MSKEERLRILRLLEEGKIGADDAARLLGALGSDERANATTSAVIAPARWLRIRVTDVASGRAKVDVNVPADLVRVAGRFGARFTQHDVDIDAIMEAARSAKAGQLLDVVDHEDGTHVEVFLE
jgi:hypothetical protein